MWHLLRRCRRCSCTVSLNSALYLLGRTCSLQYAAQAAGCVVRMRLRGCQGRGSKQRLQSRLCSLW